MNNKDIPIIIQATNKSPVMEAKALVSIKEGYTVLAYLVERLQKAWNGPIVLATTTEKHDESLYNEGLRLGIDVFRGEQANLVKRLYDVANQLKCLSFVRVYGNYPLTDIASMENLIEQHLKWGVLYSYNGHRNGVLWGMECEVLNLECLEQLLNMNLNPEQLETATFFVRQNPERFPQYRMESRILRPSYKVALETFKDLILIQDIVRHIDNPDMASVINYLDDHPILANSNFENPAQEVGLEKLFIHPQKIEALVKVNEQPDNSYPISVELSLTNRCNLKCVYCSDRELRDRQGIRESLDKNTLFGLFDDLKEGGTKGIVIEGGGEPTMHPDFEEIVNYIDKIGLASGLITNGTRRISPEILKKLEWIRVSLDASTPIEYETLKKVDYFEEVLTNIYSYARYCPTVGIGYVVTNQNISQLETLVMRLREYGASYIQLRPVVDCPELYPDGEDINYLNFYQAADYAIITDGMRENACGGNNQLPCWAHSLTTVITAEGSVYLCGRLNIYDWVKPIGNICEESFRQIWLGQERHWQAKQVLDASFCLQYCPQCRISKFNQLVYRMQNLKTPNFI
jgi:spore coat polysaccharide biosynthesis protein SpsF (cytidylyltransferase family)/MoaA/NifB/PqqE/SkfB family radical SAM enzyme